MITRNQYDEFLKNILEEIDSDWVIIGGSLLAIIQASKQATAAPPILIFARLMK